MEHVFIAARDIRKSVNQYLQTCHWSISPQQFQVAHPEGYDKLDDMEAVDKLERAHEILIRAWRRPNASLQRLAAARADTDLLSHFEFVGSFRDYTRAREVNLDVRRLHRLSDGMAFLGRIEVTPAVPQGSGVLVGLIIVDASTIDRPSLSGLMMRAATGRARILT